MTTSVPLRRCAEQYLAMRRALGYKLVDTEYLLMQFIDHLERSGAVTIRTEEAVAWATATTRAAPKWQRRRLSVVRGFARHLHALDPSCEVPPAGLLRCYQDRPVPHLYSEAEIAALMRAASTMSRQPLRAATYRTLIGLLAVTGIRVGEAARLNRDDVDLDTGLLNVIDSKYGKSRHVLLHDSTVAALRDYSLLRDTTTGTGHQSAFFVSTRGRLLVNTIDYTFAGIVDAAGILTAPGSQRPRVHDLRHSFAVRTLLEWYRSGADVQSQLPLLSTWMGHISPASTYWYLQAAPELLALAAQRLEHPIPTTAQGALSWPRSRRFSKRSSPTT
jgi:integrase/recombinase XerD